MNEFIKLARAQLLLRHLAGQTMTKEALLGALAGGALKATKGVATKAIAQNGVLGGGLALATAPGAIANTAREGMQGYKARLSGFTPGSDIYRSTPLG